MSEDQVPLSPQIVDLVEERAVLRAARDFSGADRVRARLLALGYDISDGPAGPIVTPRALDDVTPEGEGRPALEEPADVDVSLQWVVEGWPEDVVRAIDAFRVHRGNHSVHEVVVDVSGSDPALYPSGAEIIQLDPGAGWGAARNVGLRRARGKVVVMLDGSIEPTGEILTGLIGALEDPGVGVVGPYGISTRDLHTFEDSPGPRVDAIEGYCMAIRRQHFEDGLAFDEKFRFYRSADIDLCFRLAERGVSSVVVDVPVLRHEHRMWHSTPPEERDRLSKRNYYRFLEHFRDRFDLTVEGQRSDPTGN